MHHFHQIALSKTNGIGPKLAKQLIAHCGSAEAVYKTKPDLLRRIPGIGSKTIKALKNVEGLHKAETELSFADKNNIKVISFLDEAYPKRLLHCDDGPLILFQKGSLNLNHQRVISVVGTRNATSYGLDFCERFIADLAQLNVIVVSGLAFGIDAKAHKASLKYEVPTAGVLAHGLDRIYPKLHTNLAKEMVERGGAVLSEFTSGTNPDRENFPKRNRIVAGLADAVVVVEAAKKGGALITAEIANSYNRDVFALPGRVNDTYAQGCNMLIKAHKAALISGVEDLDYLLGWRKEKIESTQPTLFVNLSAMETQFTNVFKTEGVECLPLSTLCSRIKLPLGTVLSTLMQLELKGVIKGLPGKMYLIQR